MAIEDGYFLAKFLGGKDLSDLSTVRNGFARFEKERVAHANHQVEFARTLGNIFHKMPYPLAKIRDFVYDHTQAPNKQIQNDYLSDQESMCLSMTELHQTREAAPQEITAASSLAVFPDAVGLVKEGRENLLPHGMMVFNAQGPATRSGRRRCAIPTQSPRGSWANAPGRHWRLAVWGVPSMKPLTRARWGVVPRGVPGRHPGRPHRGRVPRRRDRDDAGALHSDRADVGGHRIASHRRVDCIQKGENRRLTGYHWGR